MTQAWKDPIAGTNHAIQLICLARHKYPPEARRLFDSVVLGDNWDYSKPIHCIDWSHTAFWDLYRPGLDDIRDYSTLE